MRGPTPIGHADIPLPWNDLTGRIVDAAINVHSILGPGLLESVYEEALALELALRGLRVERQVRVALEYGGRPLAHHLRTDLVVEGIVLVEIKAVEELHAVHRAQVVSPLRLSGMPIGLLVKFHTVKVAGGIKRFLNPAVSARLRCLPDSAFAPRARGKLKKGGATLPAP